MYVSIQLFCTDGELRREREREGQRERERGGGRDAIPIVHMHDSHAGDKGI